MASEAQKRAIAKYDQTHKNDYKWYKFRFNKKNDAAVIARLDTVDNKQDYIRSLILADMKRNGVY